jgi:mannose-6-phosphate isomerase-like protein (cupin superfamily)
MALSPGVVSLNDGRLLRPNEYLSDGWRSLQVIRIAPSEERRFASTDVEHALYVMHGAGVARNASQEIAVEPGIALTVPYGSEVVVSASSAGELEIFHVALVVA